jgi:hypothetical protein
MPFALTTTILYCTGRLVSDPCVALASPKHFQPRFIYRLISIAGLEGLLLSFSFSTGC